MQMLEVRNAELMESLTTQAAEHDITHAAIVALIGAVDDFTVSTNPAGDPTAHTYSRYPLPAEMTATGEIIDGKPHIHAVMAIQGDRAVAGHLHKAHSTWLDRSRCSGSGGVQVDGVQRARGGHEQPVPGWTPKTQIRTGFGQKDLADPHAARCRPDGKR